SYAAVKFTDGSRTILPGAYPSIEVAGTGSLTMSPGVYTIQGGGFKVSGQASVTGTGVSIVNTTGSGGTVPAFNISGQGSFNLTPTTSGMLAGILLYQPSANTARISISGNGTLGMSGIVYAPSAQVNVSGNG